MTQRCGEILNMFCIMLIKYSLSHMHTWLRGKLSAKQTQRPQQKPSLFPVKECSPYAVHKVEENRVVPASIEVCVAIEAPTYIE